MKPAIGDFLALRALKRVQIVTCEHGDKSVRQASLRSPGIYMHPGIKSVAQS